MNNPAIPEELRKYIASFEITVNEAMIDLSKNEKLTIIDTMTPTLDYIAGSMKITARDTSWQTTTLTEGTDFTVSYNASSHVLTIVLKNPGQYLYTIDYDTEINITGIPTGEHNYSNTAEITIFGKEYGAEVERVPITDIAATSTQYIVKLNKVDSNNELVKVPGARLALFARNSKDEYEKRFEGVTDENGELDFVTSVTAGTLLHEHELYYIQEQAAPDGYKLDDSKHWFYFCNGLNTPVEGMDPIVCTDEDCKNDMIGKDENAKKMPGDNITIQIENELDGYTLPATGGPGILPYMLVGWSSIIISLVCGYRLLRKRRRGES